MNELQHTATATLAVLNRVQIGLERIRTGNGSAALLPTLADQLRDAVKIIELAVEFVPTSLVTHTPTCLLYTSPSPRDRTRSRMPSSA